MCHSQFTSLIYAFSIKFNRDEKNVLPKKSFFFQMPFSIHLEKKHDRCLPMDGTDLVSPLQLIIVYEL